MRSAKGVENRQEAEGKRGFRSGRRAKGAVRVKQCVGRSAKGV